jgi:hypothetical protein
MDTNSLLPAPKPVKFTFNYQGFDYEVLAEEIYYEDGEKQFPSGNYDLEIITPGGLVKTGLYPTSDQFLDDDINFEAEFVNLLACKVLDAHQIRIS